MSYVLDMQEWQLDSWNAQEITDALEGLLDFLDLAKERGETVWLGRHVNNTKVYGERSFWELFDRELGLGLSNDLIQEFSGHFNSAIYYDDDEDTWPAKFSDMASVSVNGEVALDNLDVLWAFCLTNSRQACACVGLGREGPTQVSSDGAQTTIHWVWLEGSRVSFWRDALLVHGDSVDELRNLAPRAYPNLYFNDRVWRGCDSLRGGYRTHSAELRRYLDIFNDFGFWVFKGGPPDINYPQRAVYCEDLPSAQLIERRFAHLNLAMAPENPNVEANENCRLARTFDLNGRSLYCHWHGKLQAWINRIHIHGPVAESDNKLVIGFVADHLPLPGD